jgi:RNA polymerase subunit RPABC4/transcription elongation factor Spt4
MSNTKNEPPKQVDEVYCRSCGVVIKKEIEICPKCGVRQTVPRKKWRFFEKLISIK